MAEFIHNRQVQFAETDMGGIVHFSTFFRYMEEAEHQFLQSLGLSVVMYLEGKKLGMPRVSAKCDFHHPARFQDMLQIFVKLQRMGTSSLSYDVNIKKGDMVLATGNIVAVLCELNDQLPPKSIPIPQAMRDLLIGGITG
ncbi:MAG: acyl-CoA thioesterase [Planctomycetes bacterium]|nr:acyl-CoA thioesterase [Planctomycetota bacterium]